jgi:hypothetical protein
VFAPADLEFVSSLGSPLHFPSFFSSSLHTVSSVSSFPKGMRKSLLQLNREILVRVIVVPALFPEMRITAGNLCLLLGPICMQSALAPALPIVASRTLYREILKLVILL